MTSPVPVAASRRRPILPVVAAAAGIALALWGWHRYQFSRTHVETDNAQVDGHIVPVLARVGGYVVSARAGGPGVHRSFVRGIEWGYAAVLARGRRRRARAARYQADGGERERRHEGDERTAERGVRCATKTFDHGRLRERHRAPASGTMPRRARRFREKCTGHVASCEERSDPRRTHCMHLAHSRAWTAPCAGAYRAAREGAWRS